jgi:hypothetical protein
LALPFASFAFQWKIEPLRMVEMIRHQAPSFADEAAVDGVIGVSAYLGDAVTLEMEQGTTARMAKAAIAASYFRHGIPPSRDGF